MLSASPQRILISPQISINRRGIVTPAQQKINDGTSLTPFFKRALLCDFECYIEKQQLLPFWKVHFKQQKLALEPPTAEDLEELSCQASGSTCASGLPQHNRQNCGHAQC